MAPADTPQSTASPAIAPTVMGRFRFRTVVVIVAIAAFFGFLGFQAKLVLPARSPNLSSTYTPLTQSVPRGSGSYDILGKVVTKEEADRLRQSEAGQAQLAPENGAVEITEDLIKLGRDAFYRETFGNEILFTDDVRMAEYVGFIPIETCDRASLERGARVFAQASCAQFHSGQYFTNHRVIARKEIGTQPARAPASKGFVELFIKLNNWRKLT